MANIKISESDKKIICETAEDILRKYPGRARPHILWTIMKQERHELAALHKSHEKVKGFWGEIIKIFREWQQSHQSKIGGTKIKEGKGSFLWLWYRDRDSTEIPPLSLLMNQKGGGEESKFYIPFAEWLEKQKECTKAISTGDKVRGKKWSNPDVMGVRQSPELGGATTYELVSAEIKTGTSTGEIITGFGQACAYKLFSHKSYLVVPTDSNADDLQRVKELCERYDIGLVVFDKKKPDNPVFELRCSAKPHGKPNPSYVNKTIKELLKKDGFDIF
jgi:hypothetical protein